jgi:hypothetical protein
VQGAGSLLELGIVPNAVYAEQGSIITALSYVAHFAFHQGVHS